jgi:hypothetical protein
MKRKVKRRVWKLIPNKSKVKGENWINFFFFKRLKKGPNSTLLTFETCDPDHELGINPIKNKP